MKAPPSWWLHARGLRLRVWELGAPQATGPAVILLHGFLDHGLTWARVGPLLHDRRVLALDQRGFGGSQRVGVGGAYHFPDYVADLDALVAHLGDTPVDLVGHSMGGTVAAWFAGARPAAVRRLALVEGMGPMAAQDDDALDRLRLFLDGSRRMPMVPVVRDVEHAAARLRRRHPALDAEHALLLAQHGTVACEGGDARRWAFDRRHLLRSPTPFHTASFAQALRAIEAPTLVVWGVEGWYQDDVKEQRLALLRAPQQVTLAGGHMLPLDAPEALARVLREHFRG